MSDLISLEVAKSHLRVGDSSHDDELIKLKIDMAVSIASDQTNRNLELEFSEKTLPGAIKAAILLILGTLYDNETDQLIGRSVSELPMSAKTILAAHRKLPYDV
ncbi:MAG: head-tail connector protein [Rikenellaceae bacterium]